MLEEMKKLSRQVANWKNLTQMAYQMMILGNLLSSSKDLKITLTNGFNFIMIFLDCKLSMTFGIFEHDEMK